MRAHPAGPLHADAPPAERAPAAPVDLAALDPAVWPVTAIRRDGVLHLGGLSVTELARIHDTPSYVVDEQDFRSRARRYVDAFADAGVYYASKAMLSRGIARWVAEEGLGIDVCTGSELEVVLSAGFPPERVTLHGNNKSSDELRRALTAGVGHIVVDSFDEITHLGRLAEELDVRPAVLIRVTVGVEAHTHEFIATAHEDQKFGLALADGQAAEAVRRVLKLDSLE
ncbi:MAG: diaminopimelate decarboxylase family protein, partial [Mycobacteriales bacterium]